MVKTTRTSITISISCIRTTILRTTRWAKEGVGKIIATTTTVKEGERIYSETATTVASETQIKTNVGSL